MKNKGIKILTELSTLVLLLSPSATAAAATVQSVPNVNINTSKQGKKTAKTSTGNKNNNSKLKSVISHPTSNSLPRPLVTTGLNGSDKYSDKGFAWDNADPNTIEKSQTIVNPSNNLPTYYNQMIIHKTGTAGILKKGDVLTVTTVATMLDGVDKTTSADKAQTSLVSAIPTNLFRWGTSTDSIASHTNAKEVQFKATKQRLNLGKNDKFVADPKDVSKLSNGTTTLSTSLNNAAKKNSLYQLGSNGKQEPVTKDNFKFYNPSKQLNQNYSYVTTSTANHMNKGEHVYSTYQINYTGKDARAFNSNNAFGTNTNSSNDVTDFGTFGMMGTSSAKRTLLFQPIGSTNLKASNANIVPTALPTITAVQPPTAPVESGSSMLTTVRYTSVSADPDIQYRFDGSGSYKTPNKIQYATTGGSARVTLSGTELKLSAGPHTIEFIVTDGTNGTSAAKSASFTVTAPEITDPPVITDATVDPSTFVKSDPKDLNVTGSYTGKDADATIQYKIDNNSLKDANKAANSKFNFTISKDDLKDLAGGPHKIYIYATDSNGQSLVAKVVDFNVEIGGGSVPPDNVNPEVSDTKVDPKSMEKGKESELDVNGKWRDSNDNDITKMTYSIDNGSETETEFTKDSAAKKAKVKTVSVPSVVKKTPIPTKLIGKNGVQPLLDGDSSSETDVVTPDGGKIHYEMKEEKTGSQTSTAPGDEITITTKATAVTPKATKINGQEAYMSVLNDAFVFPYTTDGSPFDELKSSGEMYRADGSSVASIPLFDEANGESDPDPYDSTIATSGNITTGITTNFETWMKDSGSKFEGQSIKGTMTYDNSIEDEVYDDDNFHFISRSSEVPSRIQPYDKEVMRGDNNDIGVNDPNLDNPKSSAAYIAFRNHMTKGDYLQFTYKYRVNDKAAGMSTDKLRFYSAVYDIAGGDTGLDYLRSIISSQLPGGAVSSVGITPDTAEYTKDYSDSEMKDATIDMTGKYTIGAGDSAVIKYAVNDKDDITAPSDATDITPNADGTYKVTVASNGKFHEGLNTVRFFIASKKDPTITSYADVAITINKTVSDHTYDFKIPTDVLKKLDVGPHTVHVFAYDEHGAKSADVTGSQDTFEITAAKVAPVVNSILDKNAKDSGTVTEGTSADYPLTLNWTDEDSKSVTATYEIDSSDGEKVSTGSIGELSNTKPGTANDTDFNIPATDMAKLTPGTYKVKVALTDDGGLSSDSESTVNYTITIQSANTPPVLKSILDPISSSNMANIEEGYDKKYPLEFNWTDSESKSVTATYKIVQDTNKEVVASGSIDSTVDGPADGKFDNPSPGDKNTGKFSIPAEQMMKLKTANHGVPNSYQVTVTLTDDGGLESKVDANTFMFIVTQRTPDLALPDKLTFSDIKVGSQRQLDTRDQGWSSIKRNTTKRVTVYQSKEWSSADSKSLKPVEFVSDQTQLDSKHGTSIYGPEAAINVKFKSDGSLDWGSDSGLFEPIATSDLADSYSTELTWQVTDAPK